MKGVALLKLGRLEEARQVMTLRARLSPDAYVSHANLGTLYTFTGQWAEALAALEKAMSIDRNAHFGREKYHRQLVVFLRDVDADPSLAMRENFLRVEIEPQVRLNGSPEAFQRAGVEDDVFDALIAMIAVYGADENPHVYFALGEVLALKGFRRLAWTAYQRAVEYDHPRKSDIRAWQKSIDDALRAEYRSDIRGWLERAERYEELPLPTNHGREPLAGNNTYRSIAATYHLITRDTDPSYSLYRKKAEEFTKWEEKQIASGLAVWRPDGLEALYAHANVLRRRCKSPGVLFGEPLPEKTP